MLTTVAASWLSSDLFVLHPTQLSTMQTRAGETGIAEIRSKVKTALISTGSNCSSNTAPTPSTAMTGQAPDRLGSGRYERYTQQNQLGDLNYTPRAEVRGCENNTSGKRSRQDFARRLTVFTGSTCSQPGEQGDNVTETEQGSNPETDSVGSAR